MAGKYDLITKPMKHQSAGLRKRDKRPRKPSSDDVFAWLMDMGTGKTWEVLKEFVDNVTAGELVDLFVIAPAGSYLNWFVDKGPKDPSELKKHLPPELLEKLAVCGGGWKKGANKTAKHRLTEFLKDKSMPRAFFMNVEALSKEGAAREAAIKFLTPGRALFPIDESTIIKNPRAKRTKFINTRLAPLAPARRIMTGLVTPRSPLDLYSQFEFLDWRILGFRSFYAFRARYAVMKREYFGGRKVDIVVGYRNLEELQKKIEPYSYRVLKKDCLDLEPKVYTFRDVQMTKEQARMYDELKRNATTIVDKKVKEGARKHVTATIVISQIIRMHQLLCGHVVDEDGGVHDVPTNRPDELIQILDEHRGKVIIWVTYGHTLIQLKRILEKEYGLGSVACFWGGNKSKRPAEEMRFLNDPKCRYMLSTPGAGSKGNTWVVADLVVYYANSDNLEHRDQSEDRAHRKGQVNRVTYVDIRVRGTVEDKMIQSLRDKINMATMITGENYREWLI